MKVKTYTKEDIENALHRLWDKDPLKVIRIDEDTNGSMKIYRNNHAGLCRALQSELQLTIDQSTYNPHNLWFYIHQTETLPEMVSFDTLLDSPIDVAGVADSLYLHWTAQELSEVFAGCGIIFEEQKIAPCPFCGFNAIVPNDFYRSRAIKVRCPMCAAQGSPRQSDEDAIRAWNRRITNAK